MGVRKKDAACLNVYIRKDLMHALEDYCTQTGRTKTIVAEWALSEYLSAHAGELKGLGNQIKKEVGPDAENEAGKP